MLTTEICKDRHVRLPQIDRLGKDRHVRFPQFSSLPVEVSSGQAGPLAR